MLRGRPLLRVPGAPVVRDRGRHGALVGRGAADPGRCRRRFDGGGDLHARRLRQGQASRPRDRRRQRLHRRWRRPGRPSALGDKPTQLKVTISLHHQQLLRRSARRRTSTITRSRWRTTTVRHRWAAPATPSATSRLGPSTNGPRSASVIGPAPRGLPARARVLGDRSPAPSRTRTRVRVRARTARWRGRVCSRPVAPRTRSSTRAGSSTSSGWRERPSASPSTCRSTTRLSAEWPDVRARAQRSTPGQQRRTTREQRRDDPLRAGCRVRSAPVTTDAQALPVGTEARRSPPSGCEPRSTP